MTTPAQVLDTTTWAFLEEGIDHLMNRLPSGLSYSKYMALYSAAFDHCSGTSRSRITPGLTGNDIYANLSKWLLVHLTSTYEGSESLYGVPLLQFYVREWERYTMGASYVNRLFTYFNKHWIVTQRKESRRAVYPVYTLALQQWKLYFYIPMQKRQSKLTNAILALIHEQRCGETIDQGLLKTVLRSFVSLGLDSTDPGRVSLEVYRDHFEHHFLNSTEQFYEQEANSHLVDDNISEYLKKVSKRLQEEEDRLDMYLHTTTKRLLNAKVDQILIQNQIHRMHSSFDKLLQSDSDDDLKRLYALLSRPGIRNGLEPLRKDFKTFILNKGNAAIKKLLTSPDSTYDKIDPKAYVDTLLSVYQAGAALVSRSFKGEAGFMASLDRACTEFFNRNEAIDASAKSSELVAKHTDLLLRKNSKVAIEGDLEDELNRVMNVFKFLEDKDVFQTFYTTKLSKRLIHGVSVSDESEVSMISKLKEACGFEYTNKLQRMFTDMSLSKDLTESFKERMNQSEWKMDINVTVLVLGTNFWPLNPPAHPFHIPAEILPTYDKFTQYYQHKHSGRKLTWLWNYSKNELRTNYLNQNYLLMTSSYQMAILLQYNRNDTLSLEELIDATGMVKDIIVQVLDVLVKAKILVNEEEDQYDLNPGFKSKKLRLNLNLPIKAEVKQEVKEVLKTIDEDRKYAIQATVVRIMKSRKTLKHQVLIQEVIHLISHRFTPKVADIKKAIDTLLEKDYIERVKDTSDTFAYIA